MTSIKVCDCFFNVPIYCLSEDLPYANFFSLCLQAWNDKRNSFMIMKVIIDLENCFIACCTKFIQIKIQDPRQDIDCTKALTRNCFYFDNNGIDVNDNMRITCVNASFSDKKTLIIFVFLSKNYFAKL